MPDQQETSKPTKQQRQELMHLDKHTRHMVKDLAKAGKIHEVNNALYAYGAYLESIDYVEEVLDPKPTNRTFARTAA